MFIFTFTSFNCELTGFYYKYISFAKFLNKYNHGQTTKQCYKGGCTCRLGTSMPHRLGGMTEKKKKNSPTSDLVELSNVHFRLTFRDSREELVPSLFSK